MDTNSRQLDFRLPNDQWVPGTPPEGSVFLIQRQGDFARFRPNMTASVAELQQSALLTDAADAVFQRLLALDPQARVVNRGELAEDPSLVQFVELTVLIDDVPVALAQAQTLVEVSDEQRDRRWAMSVVITAEVDDINNYRADYQALLQSVRPAW